MHAPLRDDKGITYDTKSERPIYETPGDRQRQAVAIGHLARATGSSGVATERLAGWDYEMHRGGKVVALVEVKCRNCSAMTYPTYMVSETKARRLRQAALDRGVAGGFLVRWNDMVGWLRLDGLHPDGWRVEVGGRADRNDPHDIERVVHFPVHDFRFICPKKGAFL